MTMIFWLLNIVVSLADEQEFPAIVGKLILVNSTKCIRVCFYSAWA